MWFIIKSDNRITKLPKNNLKLKDYCMKRILISGGQGFIGKSLIDSLLKINEEIHITSIDIKDTPLNTSLQNDKTQITKIDIRNEKAVNHFFNNSHFDGVIHLAAISRVVDAEYNKKNCIDTNYYGTLNIMKAISSNGTKPWVIFASSREVYGEQEILPVSENADKLPINVYGFYKLEGERIVKELIDNYFILRLSNVYGNYYDIQGRVIPQFIANALLDKEIEIEGGGQIIDFTHISDTVNSIVKCIDLLESNKIKEELHLSPGNENTLFDIIEIIEKHLGKEIYYRINNKRNYDVQRFVGDTKKRELILGKDEFLDIQTGLSSTIEVYKNHLKKYSVN